MCCCDSASSERVSTLEKQVDALKTAVLCLATPNGLKNWATERPAELAEFLSSLDPYAHVGYNFDCTFTISDYNRNPNQEIQEILRRCGATFHIKR